MKIDKATIKAKLDGCYGTCGVFMPPEQECSCCLCIDGCISEEIERCFILDMLDNDIDCSDVKCPIPARNCQSREYCNKLFETKKGNIDKETMIENSKNDLIKMLDSMDELVLSFTKQMREVLEYGID